MSSLYDLPIPGDALPAAVPMSEPAPRPTRPGRTARPHLRAVPDEPLDFDGAVRRLTPRLQRYAVRRMGDPHEAEELVQEALLRAFDHRSELLTEDDLCAWATVVTGRLVIDRLRVRGRTTSVAEVPEGSRVGRDTADVVVARDEARTALDALDAMPARQAAVLWAREVEGQAYDEIGRRFGMSEPAVRSILTRARKALRKEYAARGGTLPVAGLSVLAPWADGMGWLGRLRHAMSKLTVPAALGVVGIGVVGGSFFLPGPAGAGPLGVDRGQVVPSASVLPERVAGPVTAVAPAHSGRPVAAAAPDATRRSLFPPALSDSCVSTHGAGVGGVRCAPATSSGTLYVNLALPDNPTGTRYVGVQPGPVACAKLPTTPVTSCESPKSQSGATR